MTTSIEQQPWFKRLERRGRNFKAILEHASSFEAPLLVETGTAWEPDNFEGQGQSTLVWDWAASQVQGMRVISIDIRQEAIDHAKSKTSRVEYLCGDSPLVLAGIDAQKIRVLYLDSFDWTPELNLESSFHHMCELAVVWAKLPKGCLVVVDDRHGDMKGKHWMVEAFLRGVGAVQLFKNHQIGWIKQ